MYTSFDALIEGAELACLKEDFKKQVGELAPEYQLLRDDVKDALAEVKGGGTIAFSSARSLLNEAVRLGVTCRDTLAEGMSFVKHEEQLFRKESDMADAEKNVHLLPLLQHLSKQAIKAHNIAKRPDHFKLTPKNAQFMNYKDSGKPKGLQRMPR